MSAFQMQLEPLAAGAMKARILESDAVLSYDAVLSLWQQSEAFRSFYIEFLSSRDYTAYRWETPPLTAKTVQQPFEFVLIASPELDVPPNAAAFSSYFDNAPMGKDIVTFPNLGKDAWLVVPCPKADHNAYSHLASFTKQAPAAQNHALWQQVGKLVSTQLGNEPKWLNTAGGGVAWLHIRLDNRPKYYCYQPYRAMGEVEVKGYTTCNKCF